MQTVVEYTNVDDTVKSTVMLHDNAFRVTLMDLESGETLPIVKIFPAAMDFEADQYAKQIVGIEPMPSKQWIAV